MLSPRAGVVRSSLHASAAIVSIALTLTACTGGGGAPSAATQSPVAGKAGGTLRVGVVNPLSIDPHLDYDSSFTYQPGWALQRCCLVRTLLSYNGRPADEEGAELIPDLAVSMPEISSDGLTWTFRIKPAIRYAPPLERLEVVAADFVRALERSARPATLPAEARDGYGLFYFSVIEGYEAFAGGDADSITGLETPDDHTLRMTLTEPVGDFGNRMAFPGAGPIPPNPFDPGARLGVAEDHDFSYGRFLVSTGPYMIQGSAAIDFARPSDQRDPASGLVPGESLTLVRNPSWARADDAIRGAWVDRIEIVFGGAGSSGAFVRAVAKGELDLVYDLRPRWTERLVERHVSDPTLRDRIAFSPLDSVRFIAINLAQPPFDDVHVRRAINYAIDRSELARLLSTVSGLRSEVATHIGFDGYEAGSLVGYDPYPSEEHHGDIEAARREMEQSNYDADGDGVCDDPACAGVLAMWRDDLPAAMAELVRESLADVGVELDIEVLDRDAMYVRCVDPSSHVGLCLGAGWISDHPSGTEFFPEQFGSDDLECDYFASGFCANYSLTGASDEQLRRWGYSTSGVPSVDDRIARCETAVGNQAFGCWAELDVFLMEQIVPWVPYAIETTPRTFSERVRGFTVGEFTKMPSLDQLWLEGEISAPLRPAVDLEAPDALPSGTSGIPDGVYETTLTEGDASRIGYPWMADTYRLTVSGGRWRWSFPGGIWCFYPGDRHGGTLLATGQQVTFVLESGVCPGGALTVRGVMVGDQLHLRWVYDQWMWPGLPLILETHPWTRVGDA